MRIEKQIGDIFLVKDDFYLPNESIKKYKIPQLGDKLEKRLSKLTKRNKQYKYSKCTLKYFNIENVMKEIPLKPDEPHHLEPIGVKITLYYSNKPLKELNALEITKYFED